MTEQERIKQANDNGLCGVFGCQRKHTKDGNIAIICEKFGKEEIVHYCRGKICDEHFQYQDLEPITVS